MDFKRATNILFSGIGHADLAKALGVSVALVRQARLRGKATAHRKAPEGWEGQVKRLAEAEIKKYTKLINDL